MLKNFHLGAITKVGDETQIFRIPLQQELQSALLANWEHQLSTFKKDKEIDFDAGYTPEEGEVFRLSGYVSPGWLSGKDSHGLAGLEVISGHEDLFAYIRSIIAFAQDDADREVMLFQNFSKGHIIQPGRSIFLIGNRYEAPAHPGLTLDYKLGAVLDVKEGKLLFQNYRLTNTYLPLVEYFKEASEEEIRLILGHKRLSVENVDASVAEANQWFRKRFAMLKYSKILDSFSAKKISARAKGYDVTVKIRGDKVIFPADKLEARRLLQFLNEELFRGPITRKLYETNSKRAAEK